MITMCILFLAVSGSINGILPEELLTITAPLEVNDSLVFSDEAFNSLTNDLYSQLGLPDLWGYGCFHCSLPFEVKIESHGTTALMLIFLRTAEDTDGRLLSYSSPGSVIDWIQVYHWDLEDAAPQTAFINTDGTIIRSEWHMDDMGGGVDSVTSDTISLGADGMFERSTGNAVI